VTQEGGKKRNGRGGLQVWCRGSGAWGMWFLGTAWLGGLGGKRGLVLGEKRGSASPGRVF